PASMSTLFPYTTLFRSNPSRKSAMAATQAFPEIVAELGALCGISRPAGQCFAAIWRAAQPPCADDLTQALGLSRSNVSTALKELDRKSTRLNSSHVNIS